MKLHILTKYAAVHLSNLSACTIFTDTNAIRLYASSNVPLISFSFCYATNAKRQLQCNIRLILLQNGLLRTNLYYVECGLNAIPSLLFLLFITYFSCLLIMLFHFLVCDKEISGMFLRLCQ